MKKAQKHISIIAPLLLILLAAVMEYNTLNGHYEINAIAKFQKTLLEQEHKLSVSLNSAELEIGKQQSTDEKYPLFSEIGHSFDNQGLDLVIFKKMKMVYWSGNQFAFNNILDKVSVGSKLIVLPNAFYLAQARIVGDYQIIGMVFLKNNYSYENQFLENNFASPFELPASYMINISRASNAVEIHDLKDQYLFSISPSEEGINNDIKIYIPMVLYLVGFTLLLVLLYQRTARYKGKMIIIKMLALSAALLSGYLVHIIFKFPAIFYHTGLFSVRHYALSEWLPSLGDFYIITSIIFFWSLMLARELTVVRIQKRNLSILAFIIAAALYQMAGAMISNLLSNSNINYKLDRITAIDQYSISGYLAIAMLLFSVFIIHLRITQRCQFPENRGIYKKVNIIGLCITAALCVINPSGYFFFLMLFFAVNVMHSIIKKLNIAHFSLSYTIIFVTLFSIVTLMVVYDTIEERELEVQMLRAINLGSEQDPVAEVLLARMQARFDADTVMPKLLKPPYSDLKNYLTRTYFSGYFRKYDIQLIPCSGKDSVFIQSETTFEPCFPYFEQMIERSGTKVPESNFYFMNNMNGRVSYFGRVHYPRADIPSGISIFIEINSKIVPEGIGFPELLMDRSLSKPPKYKYLSSAKYFDGELVNFSGEYNYNNYLKSYNISNAKTEFEILKWDGYDHLIYHLSDRSKIIVSNRSLRPIDYLTSYPYIFVFYFLFALTALLARNLTLGKPIATNDLRFRIQGSIIAVVIISNILVAAATIHYNIQGYRERHQTDLQEKMQSISNDIMNRLVYVNSISPELRQWLFIELNRLSNVFRTDINIYGIDGELLATSRPEIFDKGLISERIDTRAFHELSENSRLKYFQPEKIGNLSYLSAYEPIINNRNQCLGYLNLPYFTQADEMKQGISTFVVTFINLYQLLFLTSIVIAIFLSNMITKPLSLIREKIRSIQLGKKNEHISYTAEDEIGALVREYNHKVDELAESAELLARSERESAWREMAKQIAHEIKNPLTPMKLNIQYLQRAKEEKKEHYDDFFNRVTKNLIEQIDTLSAIATGFSNFAQIPKAKNETFDLADVIQNVCSLFEPNPNLDIVTRTGKPGEIMVHIDKEQFSRALLNLVKNAVQAIPAEQKGEIVIEAKTQNTSILISITDNGTGISPEAQENLFSPNFTTKTSGMGLGLSIAKNIVENFNGKIWYETQTGLGTTFFIEIPLHAPRQINKIN